MKLLDAISLQTGLLFGNPYVQIRRASRVRFSQDFIERILESSNLVDLISQYTSLKPSGSGLMGRCPFPDHPEKTPSFSVSEIKQVYNCFGCHKKGNILTFLRDLQGLSFVDAIEFLARRANIEIPEQGFSAVESRDTVLRRRIIKLNHLALDYFTSRLQLFGKLDGKKLNGQENQNTDETVLGYLEKRGLSQDSIETFQLGYAEAHWDHFVQFLRSKGEDLKLAEDAKLIRPRGGGVGSGAGGGGGDSQSQPSGSYYDIFRSRLIFPILSASGEVVAFGGRALTEDNEPKYLNSPESLVFHKGKILYGLFYASKYIRAEEQVIIVEGYMDMISLFQAGIKNVVATMGTALTNDHVKILRRLTKNVVVLFDGDRAGISAAEKSLPILLGGDILPKGLILQDNMDPDESVRRYGPQALKQELSMAPDLFSLVLSQWMQGFRGDPSEKIKLIDRIRPVFNVISDKRLKDLYFEEIATKMGVHFHWLSQTLKRNGGPTEVSPKPSYPANYQKRDYASGTNISNPVVNPVASSVVASQNGNDLVLSEAKEIVLQGSSKPELNLMGLALKSRANFEIIKSEDVIEGISSEGVKTILQKADEVYRQDPSKFDRLLGLFVSCVDQPELLFWNDTLGGGDFSLEIESRLINDCLKRVRENSLRLQAKSLLSELNELKSLGLSQEKNVALKASKAEDSLKNLGTQNSEGLNSRDKEFSKSEIGNSDIESGEFDFSVKENGEIETRSSGSGDKQLGNEKASAKEIRDNTVVMRRIMEVQKKRVSLVGGAGVKKDKDRGNI